MNELYYGQQELPDLDDIDYMAGDGIVLTARNEETSAGFTFDRGMLKDILKRIYSREFHPLTEIEERLFEEIFRIMTEATDEGFVQSGAEVPVEFRQTVDYENAIWSAFKVHRMQRDVASQLLDANGRLKPFEQWVQDVDPLLNHHVDHWLHTEYNTAVVRAHQAADWQRFEANRDIMPNLRWMPSTSAKPGTDHRPFWGVTLPMDHPFWNSHRPGDRWGCKCSLENTDEPASALPDDPNPEQNRPAPGLDNNPGVDGKLFSDTHPYVREATKEAVKVVESFVGEYMEAHSSTHKKKKP